MKQKMSVFPVSGSPDPGSGGEPPKGLLEEMAPHLVLKRKKKALLGISRNGRTRDMLF